MLRPSVHGPSDWFIFSKDSHPIKYFKRAELNQLAFTCLKIFLQVKKSVETFLRSVLPTIFPPTCFVTKLLR